MNEIKENLRKIMLMRQENLTESYIEKAGKNIQTQILLSQVYQNSKKIFIYVSTPKEPSTIEIINQALKEGKEIYIPKCENKNMFAVKIHSLKNLIPNKIGILEPRKISDNLTANEFDLIIVPCLSASLDGKRLGHGSGYYDKFLADSKENQNIICLCFYKMLNSEIPMNENDFFIPKVLTEEKTFLRTELKGDK